MNTNEKIVVAIVGMCGSGKSVATEFFVKNGFNKIYFGAVTLEAITAQRLEITPDNERSVREALREKDGLQPTQNTFCHELSRIAVKVMWYLTDSIHGLNIST